jgi:cation:H+ antiporter
MDLSLLMYSLLFVVLSSVVIMYACNAYEDASDYLGRNMPPGVKGATINAIGSSLPELFTGISLIFTLGFTGFLAAIGTTAGSAIFNGVIIPAMCILAVMFIGVKQSDGTRKKIPYIQVDKKTILRDGIFLLTAEVLVIYLLGGVEFTLMHSLLIMIPYVAYFGYLMYQIKTGSTVDSIEDDDEEDNDEPTEDKNILTAILTFDFNYIFFNDQDFNTSRAWTVLGSAVVVIGIACHFLANAVIDAATALQIPTYFAAAVLAAAATSVPDTVLSVKDALKGEYDDAVANAVGSNIFDITICTGLPLFMYILWTGGSLMVPDAINQAYLQELRVFLVIITTVAFGLYFFGSKIGKGKAVALFGLYGIWITYLIGRASEWVWLQDIINLF